MEVGKEKGFVLYDEVNELLAEDFPSSGREFEDLLSDLDSAGVEILEEPKLDFEKKEEPDDFADLELAQDVGDKTNDPVRMYLREMGTVPLLTREGEIELAKRNERGQWAVRKALSRSPLVIREIIQLGDDLRHGVEFRQGHSGSAGIRDHRRGLHRPASTIWWPRSTRLKSITRRAQQHRQKLQAVSRQMKPKQHRSLRYALARTMVQISRIIRDIAFSIGVRRSLAGRLRRAVDELKPLEREIARIQRKLEEPADSAHAGLRAICARSCGSPASASSSSRKNAAPAPPSFAARCRSSSAASRKPRSPRSS